MSNIHPSAIVAKEARIAASAKIGPFCVIGPEAEIADTVTLHSHVVVEGATAIGEGTEVFPFASLGHKPQDLKYKGEKTKLTIGRRNTIREHVTMNPGTAGGGGVTRVGDDSLFMVGAHVAHDCQVGNHVILANNATLAGHVQVEDFAIIGGLSAVHQFVRIGKHAIVGGMSGVENDVIPYGSVIGERAWLAGLNLVGLKRRGFERDTIHALRSAFKMLFLSDDGTLIERTGRAQDMYADTEAVQEILDFMAERGQRALCTPRRVNGTVAAEV
jgi:UDP-N-acetylglucosamine acyltransferase